MGDIVRVLVILMGFLLGAASTTLWYNPATMPLWAVGIGAAVAATVGTGIGMWLVETWERFTNRWWNHN